MNELINLGNGQFVKVIMLKGEQGVNIASIVKTSTSGLVDTYTISLTDGSTHTFTVTNGKSIVSIELTSTSGLVDTYTITFNDSTTTTFDVTNGNGISDISKTSSQGLVDTYTITFTNGATSTYTVANGKGITSIEKTATSGLVDTYTITFNDSTSTTFEVTNGANGQDVGQSNLAPVETGNTASQSYAVDSHLIWNGIYYEVIQAIAVGGALNVGVNIQQDTVNAQIESVSNNINKYSLDEQLVGKWVDGSNLYKRTFKMPDVGTLSANSSQEVTKQISGDKIVQRNAEITFLSGGNSMTQFRAPTRGFMIYITYSSGLNFIHCTLFNNTAYSEYDTDIYVTLYYTKG